MGKTIRSDKYDLYDDQSDYTYRRTCKEAIQRERQTERRMVYIGKHSNF